MCGGVAGGRIELLCKTENLGQPSAENTKMDVLEPRVFFVCEPNDLPSEQMHIQKGKLEGVQLCGATGKKKAIARSGFF